MLSTFSDEICHDPNLITLCDRVTVVSDAHMSETAAMIRIKRHSAPAIEAYHDLLNPLQRAMREDKVRSKAASLLGCDAPNDCWESIRDLSYSKAAFNLDTLVTLMR